MRYSHVYLLSLACCAALSACKGETAEATTDQPDAPAAGSLLDTASQKAVVAAKAASIPQPDLARPLADYTELKDGQQLMFLYVAASRLPPDFDKLADSYSQEYRGTSDTFRKHDLLEALKPQLQQGIAQAAGSPYAWVELDDAGLEPYDFERKGFPVGEFADGDRYRYFNNASNYHYSWANHDQVRFAPVADEAVARQLESMRTKWNEKPRLKVFFFAQSADLNSTSVNAHVTRVQIVDRSGQVLAEYGPGT
jgi:hypothetical protein